MKSSHALCLASALFLLPGCGGGGSSSKPAPPQVQTVAVSPAGTSLKPGSSQVFNATIDRAPSARIQWTCTGGTVTPATGATTTFTAGMAPGAYTVTATSLDQPDRSARAAGTVLDVPVLILDASVSKSSINQPIEILVMANTAADPSLTWTLGEEAPFGTVNGFSSKCMFAPPGVPGTYHLRATSTLDPSVFADHVIQVVDDDCPHVEFEASTWPASPGTPKQLVARTLNCSDPGVRWSIATPGSAQAVGTVTPDGLYTPPALTGTASIGVALRATSTKDPSIGATQWVNVDPLAILPQGPAVETGKTLAFSATLNGAALQGVTWRLDTTFDNVSGFPLLGTLTTQGAYQAPEAACNADAWAYYPTMADTHRTFIKVRGHGTFRTIAQTGDGRKYRAGIPFPDGRILLGQDRHSSKLAWLDPVTGATQSAGSLTTIRHLAGMVLLKNGKVLVTGGLPQALSRRAEIFDPATGLSRRIADMNGEHVTPVAAVLPDGTVLVAGGTFSNNLPTDVAEIFDPATESFTPCGPMKHGLIAAAWATLLDGRVVIAGASADAQVFDPVTRTFATTGSRACPGKEQTATRLGNGKVLFTGRQYEGGNVAEIFDPATNTFQPTQGFMKYQRAWHAAVALDAHRVLVTGGGYLSFSGACEIYDDRTGTFTFAGTLVNPRNQHLAFLNPDGSVTVVGGQEGAYGGLGCIDVERWDTPPAP